MKMQASAQKTYTAGTGTKCIRCRHRHHMNMQASALNAYTASMHHRRHTPAGIGKRPAQNTYTCRHRHNMHVQASDLNANAVSMHHRRHTPAGIGKQPAQNTYTCRHRHNMNMQASALSANAASAQNACMLQVCITEAAQARPYLDDVPLDVAWCAVQKLDKDL
eukprot:1160192-Pelagomonas_calceolata.AAC.6